MPAIEATPGNRRSRFRPPGREDVPRLPYGVVCPPEGVNRCYDLVARTVIRPIHLKADIRGRSHILAPAVNRRRAAEAAAILAQRFRRDGSRRLVQTAKDCLQIVLRIEPNEMFWQGSRLDQEEPPHILRGKLLIGSSIHRQCRSDVHKTNLFDAFWENRDTADGRRERPDRGQPQGIARAQNDASSRFGPRPSRGTSNCGTSN